MARHFGCVIRTKEPYLTRENYIHGDYEYRRHYSRYKSELFSGIDERVEQRKREVLLNYDLNMAYYKSLDQNSFDAWVEEKIVENSDFIEVTDLNDFQCPGLYIMVLGKYRQIYVGISKNIKKRIQAHWTIQKDLFRLLWGGFLRSKLSIDSFRVLDTTRIFVRLKNNKKKNLWDEESKLVDFIPACYSCNRMGGGEPFEQILSGKLIRTAELPEVTQDNIETVLPNYSWDAYSDILNMANLAYEDFRKNFTYGEE